VGLCPGTRYCHWQQAECLVHQATPFEAQSASTFVSQQVPPTLPRPGNLPQPQGRGCRDDPSLRFQPYQAGPVPRSLEVHIFHHFRRGHGVPPDIALDMRAQSMISVYPSSLAYLDYQRLAAIPTRRHRASGAVIPALYWVRILTVKHGPRREHVEHLLSEATGPCRCHNCEYDRRHGMMMSRQERWS
jgi:hypothetical protein